MWRFEVVEAAERSEEEEEQCFLFATNNPPPHYPHARTATHWPYALTVCPPATGFVLAPPAAALQIWRWFAVGGLHAGRQERDGVGDEVARHERGDADHREAPVLQLGIALASQRLRRQLRGEAQRIPEQRDLARRATRHVVRLHRGLAQQLKNADDAQDLELAVLRDGVPRGVAHAAQALECDALRRRQVAREERAARGHPRPARDGRHRDARVLELSSAVPGEGLSGGNLGEAQRVEDLAAGLDAHTLHVSDAHAQRRRSRRGAAHDGRRRVERGGGGEGQRQHGLAGA